MANNKAKHNDYELAHRYLYGDRYAGELLYKDVFVIVKKYIDSHKGASMLSCTDKEDVFSESLKCSVEKMDLYNGECSFCTYVCSMANNFIKNKNRQVCKRNNLLQLSADIPLYADPLVILIEKERRNYLIEMFNDLPPTYANVLNCKMEGMSAEEIASVINCSVDTYYTTYHRATKALRKIYFQKV